MKMKKRFLGILLSLTLVLGLMSGMSLTAYAATDYSLWIGGVQVTSENLTIDSTDTSGVTAGKAVFEPDTNTLTLDGFQYTGPGRNSNDSYTGGGIDYRGDSDLTIKLVGDNSITKKDDNSVSNSHGIYFESSDHSLIIEGEGNLTIGFDAARSGGKSNGIFCEPGAFVMNGTGTVTSNGGTGDESAGIFTTSGITVNSGTFIGNGMKTTAYECRGIYSDGTIAVNGGTAKGTAAVDNDRQAYGFHNRGGEIIVSGGTLIAEGKQEQAFSDAHRVSIGDGWKVTITGTVDGSTQKTYEDTSELSECMTVKITTAPYSFDLKKGDITNGDVTMTVNGEEVTEAIKGDVVTLEAVPTKGYTLKEISAAYLKGDITKAADLASLLGDAVFAGGDISQYYENNQDYNFSDLTCKAAEDGSIVILKGTETVAELPGSTEVEVNDWGYIETMVAGRSWYFNMRDGQINSISVYDDETDRGIYCAADGQTGNGSMPQVPIELTTVTKGSVYSFTMPLADVTITAVFESSGTAAETSIDTEVNTSDDAPAVKVENLDDALAEKLLTDEEKEAYESGTPVLVYLDVKVLDKDDVPAADTTAVEKVLSADGYTYGICLDLSLWKKLGNSTPTQIHDTKGNPIKIKVAIPDTMKDVPTGYTRKFQIIRVHDGVATVMAEGTGSELEISSDKFSSYFLVYKDTKVESEATTVAASTSDATTTVAASTSDATTATATESAKTSPKTGDAMPIAVLIVLMITAAGAFVIMDQKKKKNL